MRKVTWFFQRDVYWLCRVTYLSHVSGKPAQISSGYLYKFCREQLECKAKGVWKPQCNPGPPERILGTVQRGNHGTQLINSGALLKPDEKNNSMWKPDGVKRNLKFELARKLIHLSSVSIAIIYCNITKELALILLTPLFFGFLLVQGMNQLYFTFLEIYLRNSVTSQDTLILFRCYHFRFYQKGISRPL